MPTHATHPVTRGLRILADDLRLNIVLALAQGNHSWMSAPQLTADLRISVTACWLALKALRQAGLVRGGKMLATHRHTQWQLTDRVKCTDGVLSVELDGFSLSVARADATRGKGGRR